MNAPAEALARWSGKEFRLRPRLVIAVALAALADGLFYHHPIGISFAIFGLVLATAAAIVNVENLHMDNAATGSLLLICGTLPSVETLNALSALFGLIGVISFVLMIHQRATTDIIGWLHNVAAFIAGGLVQWISDLSCTLEVVRRNRAHSTSRRVIANWLMPILLLLCFLTLFTIANPVVSLSIAAIDITRLFHLVEPARIIFWCVVLAACWPFLRVRLKGQVWIKSVADAWPRPRSSTDLDGFLGEAAIVRALVLFNILFAVQISLDAIYLWGGASLPDGMTYAAYAHRGAYTLIATALLAAAFVLFATHGEGHTKPALPKRVLILLWTGQNLVLVVSCIHRLGLYVDVYALTYWRVAAFLWMLLVLIGLGLIFARIFLGRTNLWLIRGNVVALTALLYTASLANWPFIIADHNVMAAASNGGQRLDTDYLLTLGAHALPAIDRAINATPKPHDSPQDWLWREQLDDLERGRRELATKFRDQQDNWRLWSFRRERLKDYLDKGQFRE